MSGNEKKEIRNRVKDDISIYGKDKYIEFFNVPTEEYDFDVDANDIEWQNDETSEDFNTPTELEVLNITNMVHISTGETKTYSYKEIHLGSLIHNCGTLIFDNCTVFYNENDYSDEISCDSKAEIHATNCTFVCCGMDKNPLITVSNNCVISFDRCAFIDCSHFVLSNSEDTTLLISNCEFQNCYEFAELGNDTGAFQLINSKIEISAHLRDESLVNSRLFYVESKKAKIDNIIISSVGVTTPMFLYVINGTVSNSTFKKITGDILKAQCIENCVFEKCHGTTSVIDTCYYNGTPGVKSCVFDDCSNIICADKGTLNLLIFHVHSRGLLGENFCMITIRYLSCVRLLKKTKYSRRHYRMA